MTQGSTRDATVPVLSPAAPGPAQGPARGARKQQIPIIHGSCVLQSGGEHSVSNTGLGSWEPLVTIFGNQPIDSPVSG